MEKTIEIPEGYEARIEGRKVIIELKESEDERIRKDIIAFLQSMNSHCNPVQDWDLRNKWLPYLEKQKDEAQKQFNLGVQAGREEVLYEMEKEQKPAEWSDEDENTRRDIIVRLESLLEYETQYLAKAYLQKEIDWLKSLRPQHHWKPSEEQMEALNKVVNGEVLLTIQHKSLESLYNDLKKLM